MPGWKHILILLPILAAGLWGKQSLAAPEAGPSTLRNLQEAHNSELLARDRYLLFAARARAERQGAAAALFRAAAVAEGIHADNMARVIRSLGEEPWSHPGSPVVRSTLENLQASAADEVYEQETMYPDFLAAARAEGIEEAIRSLSCAAAVEEGHAALFSALAAGLEQGPVPERTYAVCGGCGHTREWPAPHQCPSCGSGQDGFQEVK